MKSTLKVLLLTLSFLIAPSLIAMNKYGLDNYADSILDYDMSDGEEDNKGTSNMSDIDEIENYNRANRPTTGGLGLFKKYMGFKASEAQPAKKKRKVDATSKVTSNSSAEKLKHMNESSSSKKTSQMSALEQLQVVADLFYGPKKLPNSLINHIKKYFIADSAISTDVGLITDGLEIKFSDSGKYCGVGRFLIDIGTGKIAKEVPVSGAEFAALPVGPLCALSGTLWKSQHALSVMNYFNNQQTLLENFSDRAEFDAFEYVDTHFIGTGMERQLVAYTSDRAHRIWKVVRNAITGKLISDEELAHLKKVEKGTGQPMAISQDEQWLAHSGYDLNDIHLIKLGKNKNKNIDITNSKQVVSLKAVEAIPNDARIGSMVFRNNKLWVTFTLRDVNQPTKAGGLYIIDPITKKCEHIKVFDKITSSHGKNYRYSVPCIEFSPDGKKCAWLSHDGIITVENVFDDKEKVSIAIGHPVDQFAVNIDGTVAVSSNKTFTIYEKILSCIERARKEGIAKKLVEEAQKQKDKEKQLFEQFKAQQKTATSSGQSNIIKLLIDRGSGQISLGKQ